MAQVLANWDEGFLEKFCKFCREYQRNTARVITPNEILEARKFYEQRERNALDALGAKYSHFFLYQLSIQHLDNHFALIFPIVSRAYSGLALAYDTQNIFHELLCLEWERNEESPLDSRPPALQLAKKPISLAKSASAFSGEKLSGLWHKHHFQAKDIPRNLRERLESRVGDRDFNEFLATEYPGGNCSDEAWQIFLNKISHKVTYGVHFERLCEHYMTGDWIVFAKHEEQNYYLLLTTHDAGDEQIHNVVYRLRDEFPFLKSLPQFA